MTVTPLPCDRTVLHQQKLRTWATKSCAVGPPTPIKYLKARQQCQIVHPAWCAKILFSLRSKFSLHGTMYGFGIEDKEAVALPHLWSVCSGTCDASWRNLLTESTQYCIFYNIYAVKIHSPPINAWAVKHNSHLYQLGFGYIHFKNVEFNKSSLALPLWLWTLSNILMPWLQDQKVSNPQKGCSRRAFLSCDLSTVLSHLGCSLQQKVILEISGITMQQTFLKSNLQSLIFKWWASHRRRTEEYFCTKATAKVIYSFWGSFLLVLLAFTAE